MAVEGNTANYLGYSFAEMPRTAKILATWSVEDFLKIAEESGYVGIGLQDVRSCHWFRQIKRGSLNPREKAGIIEGEQSPRSEEVFRTGKTGLVPTMWRERGDHVRLIILPAFSLWFPHKRTSINNLKVLEESVGQEIPMVVYPPNPGEEDIVNYPFAKRLFKPTAEVMRNLRIADLRGLVEFVEHNRESGVGLNGIVLDTYFAQTLGVAPEEAMEILQHIVDKIVISLGRRDVPIPGLNTQSDLQAFVDGRAETPAIRLLRAAKDLDWQGRVGTLVPATAMNVLTADSRLTWRERMVKGHRMVVNTTNGILAA